MRPIILPGKYTFRAKSGRLCFAKQGLRPSDCYAIFTRFNLIRGFAPLFLRNIHPIFCFAKGFASQITGGDSAPTPPPYGVSSLSSTFGGGGFAPQCLRHRLPPPFGLIPNGMGGLRPHGLQATLCCLSAKQNGKPFCWLLSLRILVPRILRSSYCRDLTLRSSFFGSPLPVTSAGFACTGFALLLSVLTHLSPSGRGYAPRQTSLPHPIEGWLAKQVWPMAHGTISTCGAKHHPSGWMRRSRRGGSPPQLGPGVQRRRCGFLKNRTIAEHLRSKCERSEHLLRKCSSYAARRHFVSTCS